MFTSRSGTQPTRAFMQLPVSMSRRPAFLLQRQPLPCRMSVALIVLLSVSGCSGGVLDAQGPVGAADAKILLNALGIMLVIVVPTIIAILAFGWWFRASNTRARYRPDFVYSGGIELVVWSIPIMVILFLGGVIWIGSHDLDPFKPISSADKPTEVQVVSLDWKWLFIYPDQGVASVNELAVPLRAAARHHDRHDERNGHAVALGGRQARRVLWPIRAVQRRRVFRHEFHPACRPARRVCAMDCDRAAERIGIGPNELPRALPAEQQRTSLHLSHRRCELVQCGRKPTASALPRPKHRARRRDGSSTAGALRCSAS